jgi:hypothetical protein
MRRRSWSCATPAACTSPLDGGRLRPVLGSRQPGAVPCCCGARPLSRNTLYRPCRPAHRPRGSLTGIVGGRREIDRRRPTCGRVGACPASRRGSSNASTRRSPWVPGRQQQRRRPGGCIGARRTGPPEPARTGRAGPRAGQGRPGAAGQAGDQSGPGPERGPECGDVPLRNGCRDLPGVGRSHGRR